MDDKLKILLGEELSKQVSEKLKDSKIAIINDGSYIPKEKFDTKLEELKIIKTKLQDYEKNSVETETLINENTDLKAKYEKIKTDFDNGIASKDKEISNINKKHVLMTQLRESGAVGEDLLINKFDLDSLELNTDGKIKEFDTLIKPLKDSYKHMFKEVNIEGQKPGGNNNNGLSSDNSFKNPFSKEHFNMTDQINLFKSNPDLYNKLKQNS